MLRQSRGTWWTTNQLGQSLTGGWDRRVGRKGEGRKTQNDKEKRPERESSRKKKSNKLRLNERKSRKIKKKTVLMPGINTKSLCIRIKDSMAA